MLFRAARLETDVLSVLDPIAMRFVQLLKHRGCVLL